ALDLRQLAQGQFDGLLDVAGTATSGLDQVRNHALLVVEEDLQQVLGREELVRGCQSKALRRLNKSSRPLGEFLEIHMPLLIRAALQATARCGPTAPQLSAYVASIQSKTRAE